MSSIALFGLSFGPGSSMTTYEYEDASNTRLADELIIQSATMPTQILHDTRLIDKKVQIVKSTYHNAWGNEVDIPTYEVKEIK